MATVYIENKTKVPAPAGKLRGFAKNILESTREWREAELSILLVGDRRIQSLNEKWRGRPQPTDVISFPMEPDPVPDGPLLIGDIVIGARQAQADAREEGVSLILLHPAPEVQPLPQPDPGPEVKHGKARRLVLGKALVHPGLGIDEAAAQLDLPGVFPAGRGGCDR